MRRIATALTFLLTLLMIMACSAPAQDSAYLAMDPQQGWTYPVRFSLETPSEDDCALYLCLQFRYEKDYAISNAPLPVAVHVKNARKQISSDTVFVDFNNIPENSSHIEQGYISFEKEIRTGSQINEFKQGFRKLNVTLSPVKNSDGAYASLNSKISAICLGFKKL